MKKKKKTATQVEISMPKKPKPETNGGWTFLTNHTHVLLCLFRTPEMTLREVAGLVGITERMVQRIVAELVGAEFLEVTKLGRQNTYKIRLDNALRHPLESHRTIGELLEHLKKGTPR